MLPVTAVCEVERAAPGGGRVPVRSVPSSSLSSPCGTQCLPFRLPGVCSHQSLPVFSAAAFSALLPPAFLASIGFSLKLHSRNQNSYFYPLQTSLLHKLEKFQMNWARYFFFSSQRSSCLAPLLRAQSGSTTLQAADDGRSKIIGSPSQSISHESLPDLVRRCFVLLFIENKSHHCLMR